MIPKIALFTLLTIASGCATQRLITATPCQGLDWFEIGRRDGAVGKPVDALKEHVDECAAGEPPNADLYLNGRNVGIVDFCTTGPAHTAVCPEHLQKLRGRAQSRPGSNIFR